MQLYATRLNSIKLLCLKIDHAISRRRLLAGLAIPTFQAIGADLVAQLSQYRKQKSSSLNKFSNEFYGFNNYQSNNLFYRLQTLNWQRTAVFATFGFCYLGCAQYVLYVKLLNRCFERIVNPETHKTLDKILKVSFDQLIHTPLLYFPAFYFIKDRLEYHQKTKNNRNNSSKQIIESPPLYRLPSTDDMFAAWKIWIPAQCVTFALARHWRLPWVASVSFIWTVILSIRTNPET